MMTGVHSFNDIHRGVPLISRAVLVARLRELEDHGVIERRPRGADGAGHEYWLTPAGEGLRMVMHALGQWGMTYTHDRIKRSDLDPGLLIWGLRKRVDPSTLPDRRVVLRFEFSGVPASRTKIRIMWLVLGRSGVDVCMKDPGFAVDLRLRGNIRDYVEVYLGHTKWRDVAGTALQFDGDLQIARAFPVWLRFETVNGLIGIGGASRLLPSHTTVRTGPYTAVRQIEHGRFILRPCQRLNRGFPRTGFGPSSSAVRASPFPAAPKASDLGFLPHGRFEISTSKRLSSVQAFSETRSAYYAVC
jgi:DNA-binding HxlR family transcriptional regulator